MQSAFNGMIITNGAHGEKRHEVLGAGRGAGRCGGGTCGSTVEEMKT